MPPRGWRKTLDALDQAAQERAERALELPSDPIAEKVRAKAPKACRHCGASPMQPTRDGKHKCQCRSERIT